MPKKVHRGTPPSAAVFEEDVFEDDREEAGARRRRALDDDSEESDGGLAGEDEEITSDEDDDGVGVRRRPDDLESMGSSVDPDDVTDLSRMLSESDGEGAGGGGAAKKKAARSSEGAAMLQAVGLRASGARRPRERTEGHEEGELSMPDAPQLSVDDLLGAGLAHTGLSLTCRPSAPILPAAPPPPPPSSSRPSYTAAPLRLPPSPRPPAVSPLPQSHHCLCLTTASASPLPLPHQARSATRRALGSCSATCRGWQSRALVAPPTRSWPRRSS